jgi:hypothetical protein
MGPTIPSRNLQPKARLAGISLSSNPNNDQNNMQERRMRMTRRTLCVSGAMATVQLESDGRATALLITPPRGQRAIRARRRLKTP